LSRKGLWQSLFLPPSAFFCGFPSHWLQLGYSGNGLVQSPHAVARVDNHSPAMEGADRHFYLQSLNRSAKLTHIAYLTRRLSKGEP
jgi:hypothetical protein